MPQTPIAPVQGSPVRPETSVFTNPLQAKAFYSVAAGLPFAIDAAKITVEDGLSYTQSPVKAHDYAVGVMGVYGSLIERIGRMRGLPEQRMTLSRRRCGLLLNSAQLQFMNGYGLLLDTWPIGPDNGTYRAKDGRYVTIIGLHPHLRDALLDYFQCPNSQRAIQAAVEKKTAQQIEDELAELNLPAGMVRSLQEWNSHPQGEATARKHMFDLEQTGSARARRLGAARYRPLEGLRVIELAHLVAGPTTGRLLAEQGADVIKIQAPNGDWVLPLWLDVNWGKKSILLDLKSKVGQRRVLELVSNADVLVNSNRPGALARLGLDENTLRKVNPNLILANASYAAKGTPWAGRRGFEQIAQAVAGLIHANSEGLPEPTLISVLINDYLTGYLLSIAVLAALMERESSGGFWDVGASLSRCSAGAASLTAPLAAERYAPVTVEDMIEHAVDQPTPLGVFTRLGPAVEFSHTPAILTRPTGLPGMDPDTTGWSDPEKYVTPVAIPHVRSMVARERRIRNLVEGFGIEDRGDGGGRLSLASRSLFEYVMKHRQLEAPR